jgi:hypothetical protein
LFMSLSPSAGVVPTIVMSSARPTRASTPPPLRGPVWRGL